MKSTAIGVSSLALGATSRVRLSRSTFGPKKKQPSAAQTKSATEKIDYGQNEFSFSRYSPKMFLLAFL
jgi:hypothetical protein